MHTQIDLVGKEDSIPQVSVTSILHHVIEVRLTGETILILPGHGLRAATYARTLAAALVRAAQTVDSHLAYAETIAREADPRD